MRNQAPVCVLLTVSKELKFAHFRGIDGTELLIKMVVIALQKLLLSQHVLVKVINYMPVS